MNINLNNYEEWMVDYIEGNLTTPQQKEFMQFLDQHPELKTELDMFRHTILTPDTSIQYPDKQTLLRNEGARVIAMPNWMRYAAAAAAVVLVFIGIRNFSGNENKQFAIQPYQPQELEQPTIANRTTDDQQLPEYGRTQGASDMQFAEVENQNKEVNNEQHENQQPEEQKQLRDIQVINAIELAGLTPLKERKIQAVEPPVHRIDRPDENYAMNNQSDRSKYISLNDNNSIVDWMNDAIAMGDEVGGLLESFILKDERKESVSDAPYKTTSVNIFGISYYSRKKSNSN